jgi:hypothetical protein
MGDENDPWQKDRKPTQNTLVDGLKKNLNNILGVRDSIGAKVRDVFILTRTWGGEGIGVGNFTDDISQVLPSPYLVDYSHNIMVHDAGAVRGGDLIIKMISKESYPKESDVDCRVDQSNLNVQRFYFINNMSYNVIHVKDNYVTWDVQVRKIDDEKSKVSAGA